MSVTKTCRPGRAFVGIFWCAITKHPCFVAFEALVHPPVLELSCSGNTRQRRTFGDRMFVAVCRAPVVLLSFLSNALTSEISLWSMLVGTRTKWLAILANDLFQEGISLLMASSGRHTADDETALTFWPVLAFLSC
jgi:hypothetical protein